MNSRSLIDIGEINKMLADRIDALVAAILPAAIKEGHEWRIGSVAGEKGRSMAIHSGGGRSGIWADFSAHQRRGDALELVSWVLFNGDKKDAVAWAKSWLGLDTMDPARLEQTRQKVQREAQRKERDAQRKTERNRRLAQAIWLDASASIEQSPVDDYLRGRGIFLEQLARRPHALRFAPALQYPAKDGMPVNFYPGMVAAIFNSDGQHVATHRTFLQVQPDGRVSKADVPDAKLTLGSYRGGFISLSRGPSGKSLRDAPAGDKVILCEGIEDGLSLAWALPEYRVLAAIAVSNFQNIRLPQTIHDVMIAADNDKAGSAADQALGHAERVFLEQGRAVSIMRPDAGVKDFNDMLRAEMIAATMPCKEAR